MIRKRLIPILVVGSLALTVGVATPGVDAAAKVTAVRPVNNPANDAEIVDSVLSSDGNWHVFSSFATNLGSSTGFSEIYAQNTQTGAITLLTQVAGGGESDGDSTEPAVCGDGSVVAFTTEAELLNPEADDDFNGEVDVYVIFRDADGDRIYDEFDEVGAVRTVRVSVGAESLESDFGATSPALSDDCSTVAFVALEALSDDDFNDFEDVYVRDLTALPEDPFDFEAPERVSGGADPTSTTSGGGLLPALSGDGNLVVFVSNNSGHVSGADAARQGVFVRNRDTAVTEHVSVRSTGGASTGTADTSARPVITPDGACVAFRFLGLDLTPGLVNQEGVFVRNLNLDTTTLVSRSMTGAQATTATRPAISPNCRYAGFDSSDSTLVAQDTNGQRDAFVQDLLTGGVDVISRGATNAQGNQPVAAGGSEVRALTDNRRAVIISTAPNIGGVDGGSGIPDPFIVTWDNLGFRSAGFPDVPRFSYYEDGVAWLKFYDITQGTSPSTYSPTQRVTRQQMALFMWKMMDSPQAPTSCGFTDTAQIASWAREATCWAKAEGITTVSTFRPTDGVNRAEMAKFLFILGGSKPTSASCGFTDAASIQTWAREGACWLKQYAITQTNPYNPAGVVTRDQMAAFLYRLAGASEAWNTDPPSTVTFDQPSP